MGWLFLALIPVVVISVIAWRRARNARHAQNTEWNDLRRRSKLFASQLAHLRDVTAQRDARK